jgi:hypothetical protein
VRTHVVLVVEHWVPHHGSFPAGPSLGESSLWITFIIAFIIEPEIHYGDLSPH